MLQFDLAGNLIEPGRLKKTFGGDLDSVNGIPTGVEIPTTGDYSGVVVSDTPDLFYGKTLTRTTTGKACARGDAILVKGEMNAFRMRCGLIGGGSSATSGNTRRNIRIGFFKPDNTQGAYIEYINPDSGTEGAYIQAVIGGVTTTYPINFNVNNPGENYYITFWLSRNKSSGGWTVSFGEGDQIRTVKDIDISELSVQSQYIRATVEWDWTYASGLFEPSVCHFSYDIFYRF